MIVEYNPLFGLEESVTIQYASNFYRKKRDSQGGLVWPKGYYGASLRAFERLGKKLNYRLVAVAPQSSNAYFIREELACDTPTMTVEQVFVPPVKDKYLAHYKKIIDAGGVKAWAEQNGVELIEVK